MGLPDLPRGLQRQLREHNVLMWANLCLFLVARRAGCGVSMEHPADPGPPYPSIWATSECGLLADEGDLKVVEFDQCCLGACSRKPTMLASSSPEVASWERHRCQHFGCPPLTGRGPDGPFGTKDAQAYPSGPCRELALQHLGEFCSPPVQEDRIGPNVKEVELAAAQEEAALGTPVIRWVSTKRSHADGFFREDSCWALRQRQSRSLGFPYLLAPRRCWRTSVGTAAKWLAQGLDRGGD